MALYYRCPFCRALMNIDPKKRLQKCKYCGAECTETEARASFDELGSDSAWNLYRSNEMDPAQAAATQTQVDKSAELEVELKQEAETEAKKAEADAEDKPAEKKKSGSPLGTGVIILFIFLAIGLPMLIALMGANNKTRNPDVQTLVMRTIDGAIDLSFPDAVLAKNSKMALDLPEYREFVGQDVYQPYARRIINFTSEDAFFNDVVFANQYYFGAVCWKETVIKSLTDDTETRERNYEFYTADRQKRTVDPVNGGGSIVIVSGREHGRELFLKDDHYFSLEYDDLFSFMDEYWMKVDELALYVWPESAGLSEKMYITFPCESEKNYSAVKKIDDGVYTVSQEYMTGFWDFEGLKTFYEPLSEDCCRIYESTQTIYVRLRCVGSGGFSDRVAKVVALEDHVEVSIVDSGVGREMFTK